MMSRDISIAYIADSGDEMAKHFKLLLKVNVIFFDYDLFFDLDNNKYLNVNANY